MTEQIESVSFSEVLYRSNDFLVNPTALKLQLYKFIVDNKYLRRTFMNVSLLEDLKSILSAVKDSVICTEINPLIYSYLYFVHSIFDDNCVCLYPVTN